jgi:MFS transporter, UMF1 family
VRCLRCLLQLTSSEEELNDFTKVFMAGSGGSVLVYIIVVIGLSMLLGVGGDEGPTARIAAIVGIPVIASLFFVAWGLLLKERPALNILEEGQSILTSGFKQIYRTTGKLYRTNIALLWFYAAVALGDVKPLTGIALTFLSSQQQFNSTDVGIAAIIMLVSTIPGAALSAFLCRKFNPIRSSIMAVVCFMIVTSCASIFLTGPNQHVQTYVFVAGWGISAAWKVTSTFLLVAAIVPEGQDAELMGFYIFADASLSWVPPLIFTGLNELGASERVGLSIINIFMLLSIVAYCKIGRYDDSVKKANRLSVPTSDPMVPIAEDEDPSSSKTRNVKASSETRLETPVSSTGRSISNAQ